jgi:hypothetical protein
MHINQKKDPQFSKAPLWEDLSRYKHWHGLD